MKLAILTPVHGQDPSRQLLQLANYQKFMANTELSFYYHISLESSSAFRNGFQNGSSALGARCYFCPVSKQTSTNSGINALIETTKLLMNDNWTPDKVYWHSDSDLLFTSKAADIVDEYDVGLGVDTGSVLDKHKWDHYDSMTRDSRIHIFLSEVLEGVKEKLIVGRTEGIFASLDTWKEAALIISHYFDDTYFDNPSNHWCIEEVVLPSLINHLAGQQVRRTSQLVFTKNGATPSEASQAMATGDPRLLAQNQITIDDLIQLRHEGKFAGAKWFPSDMDNPVYKFLESVT
jgi:hypothetical protein